MVGGRGTGGAVNSTWNRDNGMLIVNSFPNFLYLFIYKLFEIKILQG